MPLFGVLIYIAFVVGFLALCIGGLALLLIGRKRKKRFMKIVGGVMIFAGLSITVIYGYSEYRSNSPRCVYEDTFHEKPTADTVPLLGRNSGFIDSASIELRFKVDHANFERLRQRYYGNLDRLTEDEYNKRGTDISRPPAMELPKTATEIYVLDTHDTKTEGKSFHSEYTEFTYNPETGIAQLYWLGID